MKVLKHLFPECCILVSMATHAVRMSGHSGVTRIDISRRCIPSVGDEEDGIPFTCGIREVRLVG